MASLDPSVPSQWASATRTTDRVAVYVATRSTTHRGKKIIAGLTRISEASPWLHELPDVFEKIDSTRGLSAIRSRGGGVPKPKRRKRYGWEL